MTWAELMSASGGRRSGNNHHSIMVEDITRQAQQRLEQLGQHDIDEIFSLRLTNTERVYGIRDGRALKLLWYDVYHGNNRQAVVGTSR